MKRKLSCLLLCLVLLFPVLTASAANPKIIDDAHLLWLEEASELEHKAQEIADAYGMDVVILTVDSTKGTYIETFADDFFDYNGYGIGDSYSGVLLVLAMDTREWAISTSGDARYAITDYGVGALFEEMAWYLSDDDYYEAFYAYLDALSDYFEAYQQGAPIDGFAGNYDGPGSVEIGTQEDVVYFEEDPPYWLCPVIGAVISGIVVLVMASSMNTKRPQRSAGEYLNRGSIQMRRHQDIYLYSQVSKTRKQTQSSSGGGGSSVHRGSSGRSHGGGHGRF